MKELNGKEVGGRALNIGKFLTPLSNALKLTLFSI